MNTIGCRIAELRKEKAMTQEELAAKIGVSAQSVSKWENGINMPDIMLLPIIAEIFSVTIDELYGKKPQKNSAGDIPEETYNSLLSIIRTAMSGNSDYEETKSYLADHRESQTAFYSGNGGAVYANSELGLIWRKSELSSSEILMDEKALGFLSALSDPVFVKILSYMLESSSIGFTVQSVSASCGVESDKAEHAVKKLNEYNLVSCREIDAGGERIKIYSLYGGHKMLLVFAVLRLASRLSDYREHYFGFRGDPDNWYS